MATIGRFPGVFKMILNIVQFFHLTLEVLADGQRAGKIIRQELSDDFGRRGHVFFEYHLLRRLSSSLRSLA